MKHVTDLLKENQNLSAWRVSETATQSYELFFVHKNLETVRATDTVTTRVTVYVDHDGARGDSTFTVSSAMAEKDMEEKIAAAVRRARLVSNQPYELPQQGVLSAQMPTNMADVDPKELGRKIADAVFAADSGEGLSINACEIFLYRDVVRVKNSSGVDKSQVTHRVMIEAIPTFTDDKQSVELYEDYRFTTFDSEKITAEIARKMREVRDRAQAQKPHCPLKINVLLRPHEISELIENLAYSLNYSTVYAHANPFKVGDDLQENGDGDKLTVTLKGIVAGSEQSAYFDDDGTELKDTCLIHNGIVENYFGASRFGQYLNVKAPSGNLRCAAVEPGAVSEAEMKKTPYLECVSLSGLQLDLYSDYIGGEIRLAYYFDGEKTYPVTGVTMSGKLSDALRGLRLARETTVQGAYEGPALMMIRDMNLL